MKLKNNIGLFAFLTFLFFSITASFGAWDKTKPENDGYLLNGPAEIRANWDAIEALTDTSLQITNAKVHASAGISDTKLAQITTPGKVSGAAITSLASVPAGAGALPLANVPNSIPDSKLAQITTAGKIDGAALTGFTSISAGAGEIPVANIPTGTTANKVVKLDSSAKLPAVDGSQLIGLNTGLLVQDVCYKTGASATTNTVIPLDDTLPQITEGAEFMTLSITPTSATNTLKIDAIFICAFTGGADICVALFQDSNTNAIAVSPYGYSGGIVTIPLHWELPAGTTSSTTFRIRAGAAQEGTLTFNGQSSTRRYGGGSASSITIREVKS